MGWGYALVLADSVVYLPTSFPEEQGWIRSETPPEYLADRWLEPGWFVQHAEIVVPEPPHIGEQDFYRYDLDMLAGESAGQPSFYLHWVLESDGPREGIVDVAPASIVAGGQAGIRFHFTIARDQVAFFDSYVNLYFFDISLGPHAYRMEVEDSVFKFWIDGDLVHQNSVPGPYPTSDSVIKFGARAAIDESTTRWARIEFGAIPPDADPDDDGDVDLIDFSGFHQCASASSPTGPLPMGCAMLDSDEDGDIDFADFQGFQIAFTGAN